jgi:UDP-2,3-diacylglucosamine pyrophosphatase LpxH
MHLGWLSDIHLNFLGPAARSKFFDGLKQRHVDAWILSGDIGEAGLVVRYLEEFERLPVRTYFVLGNHDFYHGSIEQTRADVRRLCARSERLVWLNDADCIKHGEGVGIVGDDGWADGRLGDPLTTPVELNDFRLINELTGLDRPALVKRLNQLGDEAAARIRPKLLNAAGTYSKVLVVTHPPPFEGATWHEGTISGPDFLPWFSWAAGGEAILQAAAAHPQTDFTVLCGHTHSAGQYRHRPNVVVHTAQAEYGQPCVQVPFEF